MISCAGVAIDRVDDLEFWRAIEIGEFWREQPPMRDLVQLIAQFCGYKPAVPRATRSAHPDDPSGIGGLIAAYPSGVVPAG